MFASSNNWVHGNVPSQEGCLIIRDSPYELGVGITVASR
jgi:hypothetical protein